jgi:hypothetical protein
MKNPYINLALLVNDFQSYEQQLKDPGSPQNVKRSELIHRMNCTADLVYVQPFMVSGTQAIQWEKIHELPSHTIMLYI